MSEAEHFQSPFRFTSKGIVKTNVQGSEADIQACVYDIVVCEQGFRQDEPTFGIPSLAFQTVPMKLEGLEEAVETWEPRTTPEAFERAISSTEQNARNVTLDISP